MTPRRPDKRDRKAEHLHLALDPRMQEARNFFDDYVFVHEALPEIDFAGIDTRTTFLGKPLAAPLLISSMTGGTEAAAVINRNLAAGAEQAGIALALGSQRKALEDPSQRATFEVRDLAPSVPLLANLGAVQLNYGFGVDECAEAVRMIDADALIFHLNPLQEVLQPEGQTNFTGLLDKMAAVAARLPVPVVVKEVGAGLSRATAERLAARGLRILDVAGRGGTSWARIESARADDENLGTLFGDWGLPTPEAIRQVRTVPGVTVIGSGGIRSGLDVAKAIALGADLAGIAAPFLQPALENADAVARHAARLVHELKIAMFCTGARTLAELRHAPLVRRSEIR
ncbi:type 2 isopentenyl-diphosphate Delta-isomerase [Rhodocaloribacter litoris]|uniref:type 2 isopentenyl-diphosphate Delta-isomerase n=1 Tax=Rhodocaloribacter litoris TaxID=2558931 RepID=UPI001420F5BC|nr:type 2 isopentenyl-diphosphate Delta-isomerase [Rhodocaloribacter litoris]QXD14490.1 type 2 isopentenyl-diphosphate Delta-isomerase [Rhodocaloribacter litoris]